MPLNADLFGQAAVDKYDEEQKKAVEEFDKAQEEYQAKLQPPSPKATPQEDAVMNMIDLLFRVVHVPDQRTLRVNLARALANV